MRPNADAADREKLFPWKQVLQGGYCREGAEGRVEAEGEVRYLAVSVAWVQQWWVKTPQFWRAQLRRPSLATLFVFTHCILLSRPAANREPKLNYATRIALGLGPGQNQLKIRLNSRKLVQNNPSSLNRNKGISVILNKFKVVAATAFLYSCTRASLG